MNTVAATRTVSAEATLLDFAAGIDWTGLPQPVRAAVSTLVADALGNAVSGRGAADVPAIESVSRALYGDGGSPIIAGGRASPLAAAGINAFQMTAHTMCDVYRPGLCHVTPEVVPAALATAVEHGATPTRFLAAVTAGLEITTRICTAMNYPAFRARGWHSPGIAGTMGAAVTAGLLAGLSRDALDGCLGLAGSQAAGSFAAAGTIGVKFHQMNGARCAVVAATHAAHGILGPAQVLTAADGGLLRAFSDAPDHLRLTDALGERWELLQISTRRYPAASTLQALVACLLEPDLGPAPAAEDVETVTVALGDEGYRLGAPAGWDSELRAMQSPRYVTAAVLHLKHCWTDIYAARHRTDRRIGGFAERHVHVVHDPGVPDGGVRVHLEMADGTRRTLERSTAPGDARTPLTPAQLRAKLRDSLANVASPERVDTLAARLAGSADEPSITGLLDDLAQEPA